MLRGLVLCVPLASAVVIAGVRTPIDVHERPTIRVATFNIHKGAPRRGPYALERTIDAIYRLGVDVIGVQEAMRNDASFACDDQPRRIAEGLRQRTRQTWTYVHAKAWITEDRRCAGQGLDEVATEDLAIFVRGRITGSRITRLNEGRVGLAVYLASLPDVPIVVTHLAANRQNKADRVLEISRLLPWAKGLGHGILVGDLNADAQATELAPLFARYVDAWPQASARGVARGIPNGATRPNGVARIDYVLYSPSAGLALESVEVIDPVALGLGEVSDHHPVVATFRKPA
jgi:endonuclease/exonuclease/phosphatase family metal-dependent hydrolase